MCEESSEIEKKEYARKASLRVDTGMSPKGKKTTGKRDSHSPVRGGGLDENRDETTRGSRFDAVGYAVRARTEKKKINRRGDEVFDHMHQSAQMTSNDKA